MGEKKLQVQMLGRFSVTWDGVQIAGGPKDRESQFVYLLQLLLHYRERGVSRNLLEEVLFGEREIDNVHHSLRMSIYNAKRRLKQAGLPNVEYICQREGSYYWTDQIPVQEDAAEFERYYRKAQEAKDDNERLEYLLDTCYSYGGEFLPRQIGVIWVAQEARRYQKMFFSCVEEAAELLRSRQDWEKLEKLGLYASSNSPFADWEVITMEALTSMEKLEEARKLYNNTVASYVQEQGLRPSKKLAEFMDQLGERMYHTHSMLDVVQVELSESDHGGQGGYLCSWPVFQGVYHMIRRVMLQNRMSAYLMLCTIVDSKGNPMQDGNALEELSERLKEAICRALRYTDAVAKYGKGQYLVLLINTTREDCRIVQKRINEEFLVEWQRTGVKYYVSNIACFPETG